MHEIVFRADSIARSFGRTQVLKSGTLWARAGSITVLLGRNGSGKTTLFRIAAGLLRPDQGVVLFRGEAHARPSLHRLAAQGLFFLPERGLLVRDATVGWQLQLVADRFGAGDRLDEVVALFGIGELLDRLPDTLSGGERRRSEVAAAVLRRPVCLLADEPFMGVAPRDAEVLAHAFRTLAADGCALVLSGHEVPVLLDLADEVVWVVAGTTHGLGTAAAAREHWQFRREYLGAVR